MASQRRLAQLSCSTTQCHRQFFGASEIMNSSVVATGQAPPNAASNKRHQTAEPAALAAAAIKIHSEAEKAKEILRQPQ